MMPLAVARAAARGFFIPKCCSRMSHFAESPLSTATAIESLPEIVWSLLQPACDNPAHPLSCGQLTSSSSQGSQARIVILRDISPASNELLCHTDARSPKVAQLRADARVCWLFYDHVQRVQLRLMGTATCHHQDEIARDLWSRARPATQQLYLAPHAPGAASAAPSHNQPAEEEVPVEAGLANFIAIRTRIASLDLLQIRPEGNLRAEALWADGRWHCSWVHP